MRPVYSPKTTPSCKINQRYLAWLCYRQDMPVRIPTLVPFALLTGSVLMIASLAMKPVPDKPVAALFPPWWSAAQVIASAAAADGAIVRFGGFQTVLVVAAGGPDLTGRLHHAGAWLVLNAGILGGCAAQP